MNAQLQQLKIKTALSGDDDFTIEYTARGQLRKQRLDQLGK